MASGRQSLDAIIIRQSKRGRFVPPLDDLRRASDTDKKLFNSVIINND